MSESIEATSFESGGERCVATWYWPDGSATKRPCIVMANGFSGTRDWILPDFARRFADAGVAAFTFDYRHLGESEGTPRQIVDLDIQRADLRAAIAHVRSEPRIDARAVGLWGTSLGGSHALTVAAEDRDIAALILNMPALDVVAGSARAEVRVYPAGHFDLYHGQAFEQVAADQAAFLRAHLSVETTK